MIRTKLHILAEGMRAFTTSSFDDAKQLFFNGDDQLTIPKNVRIDDVMDIVSYSSGAPVPKHKLGAQDPCISRMLKAASYVIDKPVIDLLRREDTTKSIIALVEAGIARLPVSPMVVEFEMSPAYHDFVMLEEDVTHQGRPCVRAWMATLEVKTGKVLSVQEPLILEIDVEGFTIQRKHMPKDDTAAVLSIAAAVVAVNAAFLMLNTLGIEKEVVEVTRLNKARAQRGRPSIPRHTVIHIGRIYKRDGTYVKAGSGDGRKMPMHVRQAHIRNMPYGPMNVEQRPTRKHLIPMCIVNYREGDEAKVPKRVVTI